MDRTQRAQGRNKLCFLGTLLAQTHQQFIDQCQLASPSLVFWVGCGIQYFRQQAGDFQYQPTALLGTAELFQLRLPPLRQFVQRAL